MTNTYMLGGDKAEGDRRRHQRGLYATNFGGGQVDITSGKFVFSASEAYWVENGKIQYPVKGTIIGNPGCADARRMIGNDMALDTGVGVCGKGRPESVPVGVGQPTLRIDGLTVAARLGPRCPAVRLCTFRAHVLRQPVFFAYFWFSHRPADGEASVSEAESPKPPGPKPGGFSFFDDLPDLNPDRRPCPNAKSAPARGLVVSNRTHQPDRRPTHPGRDRACRRPNT